jgi:integrase
LGLLAAYAKAYQVNHREKSALRVRSCSAHLERLMGALLVPDVTQDCVIDYMRTRQQQGASGRTINLELMTLSRAMGQTWKTLWPRVKKLEENRDVGRALEAEEEKAILEAAARSTSRLIYPYLTVLTWTGMRADEARLLQWHQVDFEAAQIVVGRAKTPAGEGRAIPMSAALRFALEHHAAWYAGKLGLLQPGWHVFPKSNRRRPVDPMKPVTSLKRAWDTVRQAAGVQCRLHDLRHSFCTKMAEAGVPEGTMVDMMGHVSAVMLRRYSHIRVKARREAIDALEARSVSVGIPTKVPTVGGFGASQSPVTH